MQMVTLTRFADVMNGINSNIAGMKAATEGLSLSDKKALLEILSKDVEVAASVVDAPKRRLAAVSAAATSKDKRTFVAYKAAVAGLESLGKKIDQDFAAQLAGFMNIHRAINVWQVREVDKAPGPLMNIAAEIQRHRGG